MQNDEIKPDVVTYHTLLNKVHTLDEGRAILADMRNDGITPNGYPLVWLGWWYRSSSAIV